MEIHDDKFAVEWIKKKIRPAYIKLHRLSLDCFMGNLNSTRWSLKLGNQPNTSFSSTSGISERKMYGVIYDVDYIYSMINSTIRRKK